MRGYDPYSVFVRFCKYLFPSIAFSLLCYTFVLASSQSVSTNRVAEFEDEFSDEQIIENIDVKTNVNGQQVELNSDIGRFDQEKQVLELRDGVHVKYDQDIELKADHIDINLMEGSAKAESNIHGKASFGEVQSEGMVISDEGNSIEFKGKSSLVINNGEFPKNQK